MYYNIIVRSPTNIYLHIVKVENEGAKQGRFLSNVSVDVNFQVHNTYTGRFLLM